MGAAASAHFSPATVAALEKLPDAAQSEMLTVLKRSLASASPHAEQQTLTTTEGNTHAKTVSSPASVGCDTSLVDEAGEAANISTSRGAQVEQGTDGADDKSLTDERYTKPEVAFRLAESGDVALLSYLWLEARAASGLPLPRRQDLPPEAFVDVAKLREMHKASDRVRDLLPILSVS